MTRTTKTTAFAAALLVTAAAAPAAVVVTEAFNNTSRTFFPVLADDLINGIVPTVTDAGMTPGFVALNGSFELDNISDGSNSNSGGSIADIRYDAGESAVGTLMYELTFDLDTTVNTAGYDIASIISTTNGSDERVNQDIEILFSVVGDSGFTSIDRNAFVPVGLERTNSSAQVTFTEMAGLLGGNVDAVRFRTYLTDDALAGSPNGATVFSEFDVVGTASAIPEPASAVTIIAGMSLLGLRRRSSTSGR